VEKRPVKESRKTRYTKMVIRNSLIELMRSRPITSVTVKEICDFADVSRPAFYTHYKDQYDLLQSIERETSSYFENAVFANKTKKMGAPGIRQLIEDVLLYIETNNDSVQVLLSENGDIDFQKKIFLRFVVYLQYMMKNYSKKNLAEEQNEYYSIYTVNGIIAVVHHWLKSGMKMPKHELANMIIELMGAIF
jgi:AcrR family transcriptional regulator